MLLLCIPWKMFQKMTACSLITHFSQVSLFRLVSELAEVINLSSRCTTASDLWKLTHVVGLSSIQCFDITWEELTISYTQLWNVKHGNDLRHPISHTVLWWKLVFPHSWGLSIYWSLKLAIVSRNIALLHASWMRTTKWAQSLFLNITQLPRFIHSYFTF